MEFNQKLQELRRQKNLTQEELAELLFVSRTAISKWESGRGYPNIESLKSIAKFFNITIDELLSGDELLTIAEEDKKTKEAHTRDLTFGLLDLSTILLLFLPFFAQRSGSDIHGTPLLQLTDISTYLKAIYVTVISLIILYGVLTLALQSNKNIAWLKIKSKASFILNVIAAFMLAISIQPYATVFLLVCLIIKALLLIKWQ